MPSEHFPGRPNGAEFKRQIVIRLHVTGRLIYFRHSSGNAHRKFLIAEV